MINLMGKGRRDREQPDVVVSSGTGVLRVRVPIVGELDDATAAVARLAPGCHTVAMVQVEPLWWMAKGEDVDRVNRIAESNAALVGAAFAHRGMRRLRLQKMALSDSMMPIVAAALEQPRVMSGLESFVIAGVRSDSTVKQLSGPGTERVAVALRTKIDHLRDFELSRALCLGSAESIKPFAPILRDARSLERFVLRMVELTPDAVRALVPFAADCTSLKNLCLCPVCVVDSKTQAVEPLTQSLVELLVAMARAPLESLQLMYITPLRAQPQDVDAFLGGLETLQSKSITKLVLNNNMLHGAGARLSAWLGTCRLVRWLDLSECNLTDDDLVCIADALPECIEKLELDKNTDIDSIGLAKLCQVAVTSWSSLNTLSLVRCFLSPKCVEPLTRLIEAWRTVPLTTLTVKKNKNMFHHDKAAAFVRALMTNRVLVDFNADETAKWDWCAVDPLMHLVRSPHVYLHRLYLRKTTLPDSISRAWLASDNTWLGLHLGNRNDKKTRTNQRNATVRVLTRLLAVAHSFGLTRADVLRAAGDQVPNAASVLVDFIPERSADEVRARECRLLLDNELYTVDVARIILAHQDCTVVEW